MSSSLKIIFAGSGEFGLPSLRALIELGHPIVQVVSQPDRPAGRGRGLTPTPIAAFADEHNLPLLKTANINAETLPSANLMVVIAFGQKIAPAIVNHPRLGSINLHASRLPAYRGAAPINWAIINGEMYTGNSIIRLADKMDAGAVLAQSKLPIKELETAGELHDRLAQDGASIILCTVQEMYSGIIRETPQDEALATLAPKLSRESAKIDWAKSAREIACKIRGLYPWPGCRVRLKDIEHNEVARLTLVRARPAKSGSSRPPSEITERLTVIAGDAMEVELVEIQPEGKRPMSLAAYRNGHQFEPGMYLEAIMSARDLALMTLDQFDMPGWPAKSIPQRRFQPREFDLRDHDLASRIALEVTRNLLLINHLIENVSDRKVKKIDPIVRKIIGVGLAQILFLDRIPHSAAVDEAVEQTKRFGKKSASGFVNALLRRAIREPMAGLPEIDRDFRRFAEISLSHPPELIERIQNVVGLQHLLAMCRHNQERPPTILRLFPGVTIDQLQTDGAALIPHERSGMVVIQPTIVELLVRWSTQGLAQPQDPTAAAVVDDCDIQPGMTVLDRCCGMGTKTVQLCERVGESGTVVAIDRSAMRVDMFRTALKHRKIDNVQVVAGSRVADAEPWVPDDGFQRVLADVPCSNSGVLARRTLAKYSQDTATLESLRTLQLDILSDTATAVAPGGLLIYSTCSIWPEENEQLVGRFLDSQPSFSLASQRTTRPSFDTDDPARYHDGGYVAVLRKG